MLGSGVLEEGQRSCVLEALRVSQGENEESHSWRKKLGYQKCRGEDLLDIQKEHPERGGNPNQHTELLGRGYLRME